MYSHFLIEECFILLFFVEGVFRCFPKHLLLTTGMTMAQEMGICLLIGGLLILAPAPTVSVVSLRESLHLLPTGSGHRAQWCQAPGDYSIISVFHCTPAVATM